jgi:protein SCO1/2
MTTPRLSLLLVIGVALAVVAARGRGATTPADAGQVYTVTGTVTAAPAGGEVTVAHDDIGGYMPAMTMPFTLRPDRPLPRLAPGDKVRFRLAVGPSGSHADGFVVTGHDAVVAAAAAAPPSSRSGRLRPGDRLPDVTLVDQAAAPFTTQRLRGRRTVLTFIFTRCPVPEFCPLMIQRLLEVEAAVRREGGLGDLQLAAVTLDPAFDTPAILDAYGKAKRLDPARWRLLTGQPDAVSALTRAFAVHVERNGVLPDHTLATAVIDGDGRIVEIWRGNGWKASEVAGALRGTPAATE